MSASPPCLSCPSLCRTVCPVANTVRSETVAPKNLVLLARLEKKQRAKASPLPWMCTMCGACRRSCDASVPVEADLLKARKQAFDTDQAPQGLYELVGRFGVHGNGSGVSSRDRLKAIARFLESGAEKESDNIYFPGCSTLAFHEGSAKAVLSEGAVRLTATSEHCCGADLLFAGDETGFRAHAAALQQSVRGTRRLVVHDPQCLVVLRELYPRYGFDLAVELDPVHQHLSAASKPPSETGVLLHRPCHLKDAPGEWPWFEGECCGAGGALPEAFPGTSTAMARRLIEAMTEVRPSLVLTLSSRCAMHLVKADPPFAVKEFAQWRRERQQPES